MKKYFQISVGIMLVLIGLVGGLIPIFQGWFFGVPGLIILSKHFSFVKKILSWAQKKSGYKKKF